MRPIDGAAFGEAQARRLLWRAGFGGTPAQARTLALWGPERAVDHLLEVDKIAYEGERDDRFDLSIMDVDETNRAEYRRAQRAGDEDTLARLRLRRQEQQRRDREQIQQMQRWWLARMIETPRPLEEKMTLFWHGRLATSYRKIENSAHCLRQNQMFRANALGNFGDVLLRLIRDPAMLGYLDNHNSRKERPNENLARELMELFSLGEGAYTERDIQEGARALTGHTFEGNEFVFREAWHDGGPKTILGASGALTGDDFVRAILARAECSRFLADGLYRFFVRCDLPEDERERTEGEKQAVRQIASALVRGRYELRPALRLLFLSERFYDESNEGAQIKSPVELVVGAIRSLGAPARDLGVLVDAMERMGQELFFPPSVAGWEGGRSWVNTSTLYVRQNILVYLLTGRLPGSDFEPFEAHGYDPTPLLAELGAREPGAERDATKVVDHLLRVTLGGASAERARLLIDRIGGRAVTPDVVTECLTLISAAPEYQLC